MSPSSSDRQPVGAAPAWNCLRTRSGTTAKHVILALAIGCSLSAPCRAQATSADAGSATTLRSGAWALLFQIDRRFTLQRFEGLVVGLERSWSPRSAVRLGIQIRGHSEDRDSNRGFERLGLASRDEQHLESRDASTVLSLQYVARSNPQGRVHVYWAAGPRTSFRRVDREYSLSRSVDDGTDTSWQWIDEMQWSAGIEGALGVEWDPAPFFRLLAEYKSSAGFYLVRAETRASSSPGSPLRGWEYDGRGFLLGRSSTTFGLAVRF